MVQSSGLVVWSRESIWAMGLELLGSSDSGGGVSGGGFCGSVEKWRKA